MNASESIIHLRFSKKVGFLSVGIEPEEAGLFIEEYFFIAYLFASWKTYCRVDLVIGPLQRYGG